MKIIEAYYDTALRNGMKRYLLAEGYSLTRIDKLYEQFGVYLSRLKHVIFYNQLHQCDDERSFTAKLDEIFYDKWSGHIQYEQMPLYFHRYLHYLHTAVAVNPTLVIDGLLPPDDSELTVEDEVTIYARPYLRDNKLTIIANPLLIKRVRPMMTAPEPRVAEAVAECRSFYGHLLSAMTDSDWEALLDDIWTTKRRRRTRAVARNVEVQYDDGTRMVLSGTAAMEMFADMIGHEELVRRNLKHIGAPLVLRNGLATPPSGFKALDNGYLVNSRGNASDKVRTLRMLCSVYQLDVVVQLTNDLPTQGRRRRRKTPRPDAPADNLDKPEHLDRPEPKAESRSCPVPAQSAGSHPPLAPIVSPPDGPGRPVQPGLFDNLDPDPTC